MSLANLALVARDQNELDAAEAMLREAKATRERLGDRQHVAVVRTASGPSSCSTAATSRAPGPSSRSRSRRRASSAIGSTPRTPSRPRVRRGRERAIASARPGSRRGHCSCHADRGKEIVGQSIDGVAGLVAADGRIPEAATLWAAAESVRRDARYHLLLADRRRIDREIEAARAAADDEAW